MFTNSRQTRENGKSTNRILKAEQPVFGFILVNDLRILSYVHKLVFMIVWIESYAARGYTFMLVCMVLKYLKTVLNEQLTFHLVTKKDILIRYGTFFLCWKGHQSHSHLPDDSVTHTCMQPLPTNSVSLGHSRRRQNNCSILCELIDRVIYLRIKLMKGKPSGSIACTRKQQHRFYWSCSSVATNDATPLKLKLF